jgi:signal transduction histidine kinase
VDVVTLVDATMHLLGRDPALSQLLVDVEGHAQPVSADAEALKIVFQNLLLNGAHAMQGRGRLRVRIDDATGLCRIAFIDTGPGIPADIRDRIFSPFFTTKARGSGLGLPTAKRLIEAHGGSIAIECPTDGGTTVTVSLPLSATD